MKSIRVDNQKVLLNWWTRKLSSPRAGRSRIKVKACGICHSDMFTKEGAWPGVISAITRA